MTSLTAGLGELFGDLGSLEALKDLFGTITGSVQGIFGS